MSTLEDTGFVLVGPVIQARSLLTVQGGRRDCSVDSHSHIHYTIGWWSRQDVETKISSPRIQAVVVDHTSLMSVATAMATNAANLVRYLEKPRGVYWQGFFLPLICLVFGLLGIVSTSLTKVIYGEHIWDSIGLAAQWDTPGGRCLAFFVEFAWCVAHIGTSHDQVAIHYVNTRRGDGGSQASSKM
jgi:cytosine/uracil/thiamine/allantoin permease